MKLEKTNSLEERYELALRHIVQRAHDQEALMEHYRRKGIGVSEADKDRFWAYIDVAHMAAEALGLGISEFSLPLLYRQIM